MIEGVRKARKAVLRLECWRGAGSLPAPKEWLGRPSHFADTLNVGPLGLLKTVWDLPLSKLPSWRVD